MLASTCSNCFGSSTAAFSKAIARRRSVSPPESGLINAFALWAVGDRSLFSLGHAIGDNWALIAGGFGLASVAAKTERTRDKSVQEIADEALHR
jgi:hypothetical protein